MNNLTNEQYKQFEITYSRAVLMQITEGEPVNLREIFNEIYQAGVNSDRWVSVGGCTLEIESN